MNNIKVYHNPRCSKSRAAVNFLNNKNLSFDIIEYLKIPISIEEMKDLLISLDMRPEELMRKNEAAYKEHVKGKDLSDDEMIELLIKYPKLIQRPIVVNQNYAVVARPTERIEEVL